MTDYTRFKYTGSTPGGDSNDYVLFSTTTAFGGKCAHQQAGLHKLVLDLFHTQAGTLKLYRSADRGTTWTQVTSEAKAIPAAGLSSQYEVLVECFEDFKLVWTNGGVAQATWYVDVALTDDRSVLTGLDVPETVSNLWGWWRGDSGTTIDTGVSAWTSRVNGHVLAQATSARQPALTTATEMNSREVIRFDGSNDHLVFTGAASLLRFMHDGNGVTIFFACVPRVLVSSLTALATRYAAAANNGFWLRLYPDAPNDAYVSVHNAVGGAVVDRQVTHATIAVDTALIMDVSYGESASPQVDIGTAGVSRYTGARVAAPDAGDPTGLLSIGGFSDAGGHGHLDVAELIIYNRVLSGAEKTAVFNYLETRY